MPQPFCQAQRYRFLSIAFLCPFGRPGENFTVMSVLSVTLHLEFPLPQFTLSIVGAGVYPHVTASRPDGLGLDGLSFRSVEEQVFLC